MYEVGPMWIEKDSCRKVKVVHSKTHMITYNKEALC